jgi:hypothetical protein
VAEGRVGEHCRKYEEAITAAGGIDIQILGVGVYKFSPYNALIVYASIPIGAIVFLFHWLKTRTAPTKINE